MSIGTPRGIRNNNPLNIIETGIKWQGMSTNQPDDKFVTFVSPEYGIRAAAKILQAYQESHGINTLKGIINRWAPPIENDTSSYITAVSIRADIEPNDPLNLGDYKTVYFLLRAMAWVENGRPPEPDKFWYPDDIWEKGLRMAGLNPGKPLIKSRTTVATTTGAVASTGAVGILTDLFGLPDWIEPLIPQALSSLDEKQVAIGILLIVGLTQWRTIFARVDDKLKGRL
ncbi:MAG: hypothetical protein KJN90_10585 [Gammaproteobacteria bacterium]|nr:hypothetical protein [Gammaproteobacteria bacterium]NNK57418.1 hypothetical protein [Desulfofustis sp.]